MGPVKTRSSYGGEKKDFQGHHLQGKPSNPCGFSRWRSRRHAKNPEPRLRVFCVQVFKFGVADFNLEVDLPFGTSIPQVA